MKEAKTSISRTRVYFFSLSHPKDAFYKRLRDSVCARGVEQSRRVNGGSSCGSAHGQGCPLRRQRSACPLRARAFAEKEGRVRRESIVHRRVWAHDTACAARAEKAAVLRETGTAHTRWPAKAVQLPAPAQWRYRRSWRRWFWRLGRAAFSPPCFRVPFSKDAGLPGPLRTLHPGQKPPEQR